MSILGAVIVSHPPLIIPTVGRGREQEVQAIYSIVETAKANGLKPFAYLNFLLEHLKNGGNLKECLPWTYLARGNSA